MVFSSPLGYNTSWVGKIICHELGHTIGLNHQALWDDSCNLLTVYNSGDASSAPIMGNPLYSKEKWWVGTTPYGCYNIQNDSLILKENLQL